MYLYQSDLNKRTVNALKQKEIHTMNDLVTFAPRAYRDYRVTQPIAGLTDGAFAAVQGTLAKVEKKYGNKTYLVLRLVQPDGKKLTVLYFDRTHLYKTFTTYMNQECVVCGKVQYSPIYGFSMSNPDYLCLAENFRPYIGTIYPSIKGVSDKMLRELIDKYLPYVREPLEPEVTQRFKLPDYRQALWEMHHMSDPQTGRVVKYRTIFNDMLYFNMAMKKNDEGLETGSEIVFEKTDLTEKHLSSLPFELTDDQQKAVNRVIENSRNHKRNNILLQGDVGCGKTIVAITSMICAYENGYQSVIMAPREVLAAQHYNEIKAYGEKYGIKTAFLHSGMKKKEHDEICRQIESGEIGFIVGTHSCISDTVTYHKLGLIVTDEEHLFGVRQKEQIVEKAMDGVHVIAMSATPIPRTLAFVVYGTKKEIIIIRTMPKGRLPVKTYKRKDHGDTFPFMESQIRAGHQCYVVCPAIEDNETVELVSIESIEKEYRGYFEPKGIKIGIVNGKMDAKEIDDTIKAFAENQLQILISTTVIEVGVNVPNATVMVVEQADRFGLASLHQLRGRVGRSSHQSYCILISAMNTDRLNTMVATTDGFKIAEADLQQRGSGDLIGLKQAGSNKYVVQMLKYPKIYQMTVDAADFCLKNGYGKKLIELYAEHELAE